jgi:hypothetical protein
MVMDVVEHVEDCFAFLRKAKAKGDLKLYHIPLNISCSTALREHVLAAGFHGVGHIHVFSASTALESLRYTGHEIIDHFYTKAALECPRAVRTRVANCFRRLVPPPLASRLFGGYSLLVLAR